MSLLIGGGKQNENKFSLLCLRVNCVRHWLQHSYDETSCRPAIRAGSGR